MTPLLKAAEVAARRFLTIGDLTTRWGLTRKQVRAVLVNQPAFRPPTGKKRALMLYPVEQVEQFEKANTIAPFQLKPARPVGLTSGGRR